MIRRKKMIKIKQQIADAEEICEKVLTDVFGEDCIFSIEEYDTLCTIIEKTLACVSENPEKLGYFLKSKSTDVAINTAALTRKKRFNERKEND